MVSSKEAILRRLITETRGTEPDIFVSWKIGCDVFAAVHYSDRGMEWLEVVRLVLGVQPAQDQFETIALEVVEEQGNDQGNDQGEMKTLSQDDSSKLIRMLRRIK